MTLGRRISPWFHACWLFPRLWIIHGEVTSDFHDPRGKIALSEIDRAVPRKISPSNNWYLNLAKGKEVKIDSRWALWFNVLKIFSERLTLKLKTGEELITTLWILQFLWNLQNYRIHVGDGNVWNFLSSRFLR